jgi:hypothetical protein
MSGGSGSGSGSDSSSPNLVGVSALPPPPQPQPPRFGFSFNFGSGSGSGSGSGGPGGGDAADPGDPAAAMQRGGGWHLAGTFPPPPPGPLSAASHLSRLARLAAGLLRVADDAGHTTTRAVACLAEAGARHAVAALAHATTSALATRRQGLQVLHQVLAALSGACDRNSHVRELHDQLLSVLLDSLARLLPLALQPKVRGRTWTAPVKHVVYNILGALELTLEHLRIWGPVAGSDGGGVAASASAGAGAAAASGSGRTAAGADAASAREATALDITMRLWRVAADACARLRSLHSGNKENPGAQHSYSTQSNRGGVVQAIGGGVRLTSSSALFGVYRDAQTRVMGPLVLYALAPTGGGGMLTQWAVAELANESHHESSSERSGGGSGSSSRSGGRSGSTSDRSASRGSSDPIVLCDFLDAGDALRTLLLSLLHILRSARTGAGLLSLAATLLRSLLLRHGAVPVGKLLGVAKSKVSKARGREIELLTIDDGVGDILARWVAGCEAQARERQLAGRLRVGGTNRASAAANNTGSGSGSGGGATGKSARDSAAVRTPARGSVFGGGGGGGGGGSSTGASTSGGRHQTGQHSDFFFFFFFFF